MVNAWKPSPEQLSQLFAALGRCLYTYQIIELRLKFLLPHLIIPGTDSHAPNEGFENRRVYLESKETLGPLMQRLKDRTVTDQREHVEAELNQIVAHRNEVIHHFASQPFSRMASETDFSEALQFLESRLAFATPTLDMLQKLSGTFLDLVIANSAEAQGSMNPEAHP